MRTTRMTKIAMVIFLSMIFFLGVQRPVLAAERNTTVKIPVEQIFEANNSVDADKTGSYVLIADQIQNPMPEGSNGRTFTWNMSGNSSTELIMNVGQQENIITSCTRQQRIKKIIHMIQKPMM